eukprot:s4544_g3.t1
MLHLYILHCSHFMTPANIQEICLSGSWYHGPRLRARKLRVGYRQVLQAAVAASAGGASKAATPAKAATTSKAAGFNAAPPMWSPFMGCGGAPHAPQPWAWQGCGGAPQPWAWQGWQQPPAPAPPPAPPQRFSKLADALDRKNDLDDLAPLDEVAKLELKGHLLDLLKQDWVIPKPVFTAIYEPGDECEKPAEEADVSESERKKRRLEEVSTPNATAAAAQASSASSSSKDAPEEDPKPAAADPPAASGGDAPVDDEESSESEAEEAVYVKEEQVQMPAGPVGRRGARSVILTPARRDGAIAAAELRRLRAVESAKEGDQKEVLLKSLLYSQDSIMGLFGDRKRQLRETRKGLSEGSIKLTDIPAISVIRQGEGVVSADNRRLWVFKHCGMPPNTRIPVIVKKTMDANFRRKSTSKTGGLTVAQRGNKDQF